jgi:signal transduction histidine kinase
MEGSRDLAIGAPLSWLVDGKSMWVGGSNGLARWHNGHGSAVRIAGLADLANVSGLVRDKQGSLWIAHRGGAERIFSDELKRFDSDPLRPLRGQHFDASEGIGASTGGSLSLMSLTLDRAGRVWSAGTEQVSFIDPVSASLNTVRPKVFIESVVIDQRPAQAGTHDVIPALTRSLSIDYTSPMLRRPEGAHFQYQLSGMNNDWQEAGNRRSAYYTNLDPGAYTFRVRAFNEDGIMSANDAVYEFRVAAAWYQTLAFRIAMGLGLLALVWIGFALRLRTVTNQMRIRTDERERIARDLHDTLLQSFQGLVLRFYAVRNRVGPGELQTMIDSALARADDVLAEGREKITVLRNSSRRSTEVGGDLVRHLAELSESMCGLRTASLHVHVVGTPRPLRMAVFDDVLAIAREAVCNAMSHSSARSVDLELNYGRRSFVLTIRDDGTGFDPEGGAAGHWGLIGMRERAKAIQGDFSIQSSVGAGARLVLRLSARKAYLRRGIRVFSGSGDVD